MLSPDLDVLRYIGAVTRELETRDYLGKPARVTISTCAYDTPIEDLWDAVTNPERLPRWFLPVSGDLRPGGRYQLTGNASGEITACDPPRAFDVTWEFADQISWVTVRLTELSDGGSRLRLEHIGHVPKEFWDQYGAGAGGVGWDLGLLGLSLYIETGGIVDRKQADEWHTTPAGREFIARSSEAWGQAAIAGGIPEAAAREAATRTTAFYTGEG